MSIPVGWGVVSAVNSLSLVAVAQCYILSIWLGPTLPSVNYILVREAADI